ncbi:DNA polymerase [Aquabacterium olei]|uniref:DNA polymerase n=1 Tax=Aquabacterium olei TaxID=1296669 RepID=A0A2U8FR64_9BURK|nr:DNA polymerase [Aquabacterium olei]
MAPSSGLPALSPDGTADARMLVWWALRFTPRVALLEEAVVLEWQGSQRLFGGRRRLMARLNQGAEQAGCAGWAHARTALGALALARTPRPHPRQLDALPLQALSALAAHQATLSRMGCRTVGDVARLPRDGLSRRFGAALLNALDQARSVVPEAFTWQTLPPVFDERLEFPARVELADELLPACDRLLARLGAWLSAQQLGVRGFTLRWQHDGQRRDAARSGEHVVRLGTATSDVARLRALLVEHLRRLELSAPVGELSLHASDLAAAEPLCDDLFLTPGQGVPLQAEALRTPAGQRRQHEAWVALLERLSVRLGHDRVCAGRLEDDHRLGLDQRWCPWSDTSERPEATAPDALPLIRHALPHPTWLLPEPRPLLLEHDAHGAERPVYQGRLTLLAGPHRIDTGWWNEDAAALRPSGRMVTSQVAEPGTRYAADGPPATTSRDYFLAHSPRAGLLWVYRTRPAVGASLSASAWFLHGVFA